MLVEVGVSKECIRVEDFASDVLTMKLTSASTIGKLIACSIPDVGNCAVTIASLAFMCIHSYAVNAREVNSKAQAIYSWASLLWETSFHTPGITMMANKCNMLLELVGIFFFDEVMHAIHVVLLRNAMRTPTSIGEWSSGSSTWNNLSALCRSLI